jgi:hypothetical protein
MMHLGKGYQQHIDRIQHELDAHENDDGISSGQYPHHTNGE